MINKEVNKESAFSQTTFFQVGFFIFLFVKNNNSETIMTNAIKPIMQIELKGINWDKFAKPTTKLNTKPTTKLNTKPNNKSSSFSSR